MTTETAIQNRTCEAMAKLVYAGRLIREANLELREVNILTQRTAAV